MKIFAIVVTYNGRKWYDRCLGSLRDSETPVETIVIDNASSDDTVEYIKNHFPQVHLIESKENLGFAKANNIGIRYAIDHDADYVFLLNQDAWVEKNTLTVLLQTFEDNENVGIASPIHLNGSYSGLDHDFAKYFSGDFVSDLYMGELKAYYEIPFVNAAAWILPVSTIKKIGGFDISLFVHYGEDDNYCQRVLFFGGRIIVNTKCTICHDKEFRKNCEMEYRKKTIRDPYLIEKIQLGDINQDCDIDGLLRQRYCSLIKACMRFSPSRFKNNRNMIKLLKEIRMSRARNSQGSEVWL